MASPWAARCSCPMELPQSFWKSRFLRGCELDFAFSPTFVGKLDWRALFFSTRRALQDSERYPSLLNRKSIWKLLEINSTLVDLWLSGEFMLTGTPVSWEEGISLRLDNYGECNFSLSKLISAETNNGIYDESAQHPDQYLIVGRELYVWSIPPTPEGSKCCGLGVSVISSNSQSYVSGIRFLVVDPANGNCLSSFSLGFVHPSLESFIDFAPNQHLHGFHVAASVHGIKVLKPLVDGAGCPWIGGTDDTGEDDVGFGSVRPTTTDRIYTYGAGFDVS